MQRYGSRGQMESLGRGGSGAIRAGEGCLIVGRRWTPHDGGNSLIARGHGTAVVVVVERPVNLGCSPNGRDGGSRLPLGLEVGQVRVGRGCLRRLRAADVHDHLRGEHPGGAEARGEEPVDFGGCGGLEEEGPGLAHRLDGLHGGARLGQRRPTVAGLGAVELDGDVVEAGSVRVQLAVEYG